jgi:hypothetical protein
MSPGKDDEENFTVGSFANGREPRFVLHAAELLRFDALVIDKNG